MTLYRQGSLIFKRVQPKKKNHFSYRQVKPVYTDHGRKWSVVTGVLITSNVEMEEYKVGSRCPHRSPTITPKRF